MQQISVESKQKRHEQHERFSGAFLAAINR